MAESSLFDCWLENYFKDENQNLETLRASLAGQREYEISESISRKMDKGGIAVVYVAISRNHPEILRQLLTVLGAHAKYYLLKESGGWPSLHLALGLCYPNIAKIILEFLNSSDMLELITMTEKRHGYTAVAWAACNNYPEIMRLMLQPFSPEERFNTLKNSDGNRFGFTALHSALHRSAGQDIISYMLDSLSPHRVVTLLHMEDCYGNTPLDNAQYSESLLKLMKRKEKAPRAQGIPRAVHYETMLHVEEAFQQLGVQKDAATEQSAELTQAKDRIKALEKVSKEQKTALNKASQDMEALQMENSRQMQAMARQCQESELQITEMRNKMSTMQKVLDDLQIYLRKAEPTDATGDQEVEDIH